MPKISMLLQSWYLHLFSSKATISQTLPLIILGILGIIGGALCLFLPETLGEELPQTLNDGENFGKDQQFWEFPCIGK